MPIAARLEEFWNSARGSADKVLRWATRAAGQEGVQQWLVEGYVDCMELWSGNRNERAETFAYELDQYGIRTAANEDVYDDLLIDRLSLPELGWTIAYGFRPKATSTLIQVGSWRWRSSYKC